MMLLKGWWKVIVGRDFEERGWESFYKGVGRLGVLDESSGMGMVGGARVDK